MPLLENVQSGILIRTVNTNSESIDTSEKEYKQSVDRKPRGLWYGISDSWEEWCTYNMPERINDYNINIDLDMSNIISLDSPESFQKFEDIFKKKKTYNVPNVGDVPMPDIYIDWELVSHHYSGIEIPDYDAVSQFRMSSNWFYTWDISGGCIWDLSIIKSQETTECEDAQNKRMGIDPYEDDDDWQSYHDDDEYQSDEDKKKREVQEMYKTHGLPSK